MDSGRPKRIRTKAYDTKTWLISSQIKEKLGGDIDNTELVKSLSSQEPPVFDPMTGQKLYKFPPKAQRVDIKKK